MLGIKVRNQFLDLFPDTAVEIELNHPIGIITNSLDELQGGLSFPIEIPVDGINASIIGRVDRLDIDDVLIQNEYCELWAEGVLLFPGLVTIQGSTNKRANLFMVFNEIKSLADINLAAIDYGGDRSIGADSATRLAHAKDTAENPLDYDYIFFPVLNPIFNINGENPSFIESHLQNRWDTLTNQFVEVLAGVATPFIRVDYLLKQIFKSFGFTLDNQFQTTDELKLMTLYNNYNIYVTPSAWSDTINLVNHVPYRSAIDFLKALIGTFALGLFPDPQNKSFLLIPFRDLIQAPEVDDWTSKASADFGYDTDRDFIAKFRYDLDENDDLSVTWSGVEFDKEHLYGETLTARTGTSITVLNIRYAIADNTYYMKVTTPLSYEMIAQDQKPVVKTGSDKEFISPLIPMWNSWDLGLDGFIDHDLEFQQLMVPHIRHQGYSLVSSAKKTLTSFRPMFYRGIQPADVGIDATYPMAGITEYNIRGDQVGDYSLIWNRDNGVYNKWWKLAYEMLRSKKTVSRKLLLTIRDLLNFKFQNKYRIENQNYFLTKLRFSISSRGLSPVDAEMITTL